MNAPTRLLTTAFLFCTLLAVAQKPKTSKPTTPETAFVVPVRLEQELLRLSTISGGKVGYMCRASGEWQDHCAEWERQISNGQFV